MTIHTVLLDTRHVYHLSALHHNICHNIYLIRIPHIHMFMCMPNVTNHLIPCHTYERVDQSHSRALLTCIHGSLLTYACLFWHTYMGLFWQTGVSFANTCGSVSFTCPCVCLMNVLMCVVPHKRVHVCASFTCPCVCLMNVSWLIHVCGMTYAHDAFTCVAWRIHTCGMTYLHAWQESFTCVTWPIPD